MSRQSLSLSAVCVLTLAVFSGCHPQQPFYFHEDGDLSHYRDMALNIEYPDVDLPTLGDADGAMAPFTVGNSGPKEIVELTLEEAVRTALINSKVVRLLGGNAVAMSGGSGPSSPDYLLRNPAAASTVYDPAIVESDPRSGVEAALSAFDSQLQTALGLSKDNEPTNYFSYDYTDSDLGQFSVELSKINATGGRMSIRHGVSYFHDPYMWQNSSSLRFPTTWTTNFQVGVRQPLLRGSGVNFNRIAGPLASVPTAFGSSSIGQGGSYPGVNSGVMIARLNTDVALSNFEANARNLVYDTENAYWELYFTYRNLDSVVSGRNSALITWRKIYALYEVGAKGGEAEKEAQAREQYFLFRSTLERSLNSLYKAEANLRYMMGIAATDGRLFRPKDEPTAALVTFDWHAVNSEALVRSVELRQQRWQVKRRELEMVAAKNYLMPQLDFIAGYRWNGLGQDLINSEGQANLTDYSYNSLTSGTYQDWNVGLQLNMPLGFRREMAGVRNAQLQLARDRTVLQEQELELSHQMAFALRDLEANHIISQTNFNRRIAAERQVEAVRAAYETDTVTLDVLLNAQRQLAQAESDFYRSVVDYNKSIATVHYRKGSLLEYNGVQLAEGPWPGKAYFDACRMARARDAAHYIDYGMTMPRVISRGEYQQQMGELQMPPMEDLMPTPASPEVVPTPAPAPNVAPPAEPMPSAPLGQGVSTGKPAAKMAKAEPAASPAAATAATANRYDLGAMNLSALAGKPTNAPAAETAEVRATSYEQSVAPNAERKTTIRVREGAGQWVSSKGGASVQAVAKPTAAKDQSTSGWTRAQN